MPQMCPHFGIPLILCVILKCVIRVLAVTSENYRYLRKRRGILIARDYFV